MLAEHTSVHQIMSSQVEVTIELAFGFAREASSLVVGSSFESIAW